MADYRVNLDVYNGPLDLLLYLIRRDEVDVYDIPIARITEQYVSYVEMLKRLDPNLAGEFLVMAATLLEIKTRMLLPMPPPEAGGEEGVTIDPRADLIRQLLEYKAFKDAAGDLRDAVDVQGQKFPRQPGRAEGDAEREVDLEDVQVWDLFDAFGNMMEAIGQDLRLHEVIYDDTPVELHAADIVDRLRREGELTFREIFAGRLVRSEIVGLFLALLELVRQKKILAVQRRNFSDICVTLNPDAPNEDKGEKAEAPPAEAPSQAQAEPSQEQTESRPAAEMGEYVSAGPPPATEQDDDTGAETDGTRS